jgi:hypothetical protein
MGEYQIEETLDDGIRGTLDFEMLIAMRKVTHSLSIAVDHADRLECDRLNKRRVRCHSRQRDEVETSVSLDAFNIMIEESRTQVC